MTGPRGRRGVLLGAAAALGGCGFHPLLAPGAGGSPAAVDQLRTVFVPVQSERSGQLFREALQTRLQGTGASVVQRFELLAPLSVSFDALAVQRDNSTSRFRVTGTSSWTLIDLTAQRKLVTTGYARVLDGYDNVNQQYISTEFAGEDAIRRISANLADRVVQQLAAYFDGAHTA